MRTWMNVLNGCSVTQNLSDGLRAAIMSSVGRACCMPPLVRVLTCH